MKTIYSYLPTITAPIESIKIFFNYTTNSLTNIKNNVANITQAVTIPKEPEHTSIIEAINKPTPNIADIDKYFQYINPMRKVKEIYLFNCNIFEPENKNFIEAFDVLIKNNVPKRNIKLKIFEQEMSLIAGAVIAKNHIKLQNLLREAIQIDIDFKDKNGDSLLHLASGNRDLTSLILLEKYFIDLPLNNNKQSPLDLFQLNPAPMSNANKDQITSLLYKIHDKKPNPEEGQFINGGYSHVQTYQASISNPNNSRSLFSSSYALTNKATISR